jgi:hypothetical protein
MVRCAVYNIRAILPVVTDSRDRAPLEASAQHLLTRGAEVVKRTVPAIWMRHAKSQGA